MNAPLAPRSWRADFQGVADWHYLDTAETAQTPPQVVDAITRLFGVPVEVAGAGQYAVPAILQPRVGRGRCCRSSGRGNGRCGAGEAGGDGMDAPLATRSWRADFPGVADWHYLDTAATAHKPQQVVDAITRAYGVDYATVHRGVYARSANMTLAYEAARRRVAQFIGAASDSEIVFVRGATEGDRKSTRLNSSH